MLDFVSLKVVGLLPLPGPALIISSNPAVITEPGVVSGLVL